MYSSIIPTYRKTCISAADSSALRILPGLAKHLAKPTQEVQSRNIGPTRLKMDQPLVNNTAFHLTFHDKDINKRSWFPKAILKGKKKKKLVVGHQGHCGHRACHFLRAKSP